MKATGVVDGNVIRVLSRLRAIGAESNSKIATEAMWFVFDGSMIFVFFDVTHFCCFAVTMND